MKLEHKTLVTSNSTKIISGASRTDNGQATSQTIKSFDLKSGKMTVTT